jgi:hypothetical protein
MVNYILSNEPDESLGPIYDLASRDKTHPTWHGTYSFEDTLGLISNGWPEGRAIVGRYTQEYGKIWQKFFPSQDYGNHFQPSTQGAIPLVDQVIIGNPENMLEFFPDESLSDKFTGNKLQRMLVSCIVHCGISIETILQRGALIAALINSMELAGFNIELNLSWKTTSGGMTMLPSLTLKNFQDRLDTDKLAFCLAHSSMLRRVIFAVNELAPKDFAKEWTTSAYGTPTNLDEKQITNWGADILGGEVQGKKTNMYFKLLDSNYQLDQLVSQCTTVVKEHFTEVSFNK